MRTYEVYGKAAESLENPLEISGRYGFQAEAVKHMVRHVVATLKPKGSDRLLDIGCGTGLLLTPLARHVAEGVGIDHPQVLAKYAASGVPANVRLIPGEWPTVKPDGTFNLIIANSVLHCLSAKDAASHFIQECVKLLSPGGSLLLADIPNEDRKRRYNDSEQGQASAPEWKRLQTEWAGAHTEYNRVFSQVDRYGGFLNDMFVCELLASMRQQGLESYVLPQEPGLPFSHTREDILIVKHA